MVTPDLSGNRRLRYGANMSGLAGWGAMLSGLGQLTGGAAGLFGRQDNSAHQYNLADIQAYTSNNQLTRQIEFQREMAQQGIRYRVDDAKRAGVSPLVALGAPTFSPSITPGSPITGGNFDSSGPDLAGSLKAMGSGARDIMRGLTPEDKTQMMRDQIIFEQQVKSNEMDIALKGAQLRAAADKLNRPSIPSVTPATGGLSGQGDIYTGPVKVEPDKVPPPSYNDVGTAASGDPNSVWRRVNETQMVRVPRDPVIASASFFNPEYLKWLAGSAHGKPPPMEALPHGTVRWIPTGINTWTATPYWPHEGKVRYR